MRATRLGPAWRPHERLAMSPRYSRVHTSERGIADTGAPVGGKAVTGQGQDRSGPRPREDWNGWSARADEGSIPDYAGGADGMSRVFVPYERCGSVVWVHSGDLPRRHADLVRERFKPSSAYRFDQLVGELFSFDSSRGQRGRYVA